MDVLGTWNGMKHETWKNPIIFVLGGGEIGVQIGEFSKERFLMKHILLLHFQNRLLAESPYNNYNLH